MNHIQWSPSEKKLARTVFEQALEQELSERLADFKKRAAAAAGVEDMWSLGRELSRWQREIDRKYDYRYGQLPWVFAVLLREGRITERQLAGLSEEKRKQIHLLATL